MSGRVMTDLPVRGLARIAVTVAAKRVTAVAESLNIIADMVFRSLGSDPAIDFLQVTSSSRIIRLLMRVIFYSDVTQASRVEYVLGYSVLKMLPLSLKKTWGSVSKQARRKLFHQWDAPSLYRTVAILKGTI